MTSRVLILLAPVLLAGCASVGEMPPRPEIAVPDSFVFAPDYEGTEADGLRSLLPHDSAAFKALLARAEDAPDLAIAVARIDAARAVTARAKAERRPSVDASASAQRVRSNPSQFGNIPGVDSSRFSIGADISAAWDLDLFGRLKASQHAAQRRLDAAGFDAEAVRIAVTSEIAAAVVDWQNIAAQRAQIEANLAAAKERAGLVRSRVRAGLNPELDAMRADAVVEGLAAQLAPLSGEEVQVASRMVALTGANTEAVIADLNLSREQWAGGSAPQTAPSVLIATRPDVQAAAARLAAGDADLAATAAKRFPRFTLSSALGLLAFSVGGLFDSDAITGSLGAGIAGPLLDFGRIQAEIDGSKAQTRIAFEELRKASFTALGEAESSFGQLAAADREAELLERQAAREADVAKVSASRYRAGLESLIAVLDQDRVAYQARQQAVAAKGRAARARLALWQSLGGPGLSQLFETEAAPAIR
jgi:outer membrane protein, multidrug efflux system